MGEAVKNCVDCGKPVQLTPDEQMLDGATLFGCPVQLDVVCDDCSIPKCEDCGLKLPEQQRERAAGVIIDSFPWTYLCESCKAQRYIAPKDN